MDRDFVLQIDLEPSDPILWIETSPTFTENGRPSEVGLLSIPQAVDMPTESSEPLEVIFIVDTSGSMEQRIGHTIKAVQAALKAILAASKTQVRLKSNFFPPIQTSIYFSRHNSFFIVRVIFISTYIASVVILNHFSDPANRLPNNLSLLQVNL